MQEGNPFKGVVKWRTTKEIIDPALKKARKFSVREKLRWEERKKEEAIKQIKLLADQVANRTKDLILSYPSLEEIHEFYRSIVEVWFSISRMEKILNDIWSAQFKIRKIAGRYIKRLSQIKLKEKEDLEKLKELKKEAFDRITSVVYDLNNEISTLASITQKLARLPDYNPQLPAVVVTGPPNSGKSTLIKKISSAKVETASYPFTTKKISFGHLKIQVSDFIRIRTQIVDTPGLFDRPTEERKEPELLALKAIRHLADIIIIFLDCALTNPLGPEGQKEIYNTIKSFFKKKNYIVAINKLDIANENVLNSLTKFFDRKGEEFVKISLKKGNIDPLLKKIGELLKESRFVKKIT